MRKKLISKLRRVPAKLQRNLLDIPYVLRAWWINNISKQPTWYTDKYGIRSQLVPGENIRHILSTHSHFDDVGTVLLLRRLIKPGMIIVDVGAAKGLFAIHAAHLTGISGSVHAFEPTISAVDRLKNNLSVEQDLSHIVIVNQLAVSNTNGTATLSIFPKAFSDWNTLGEPANEFKLARKGLSVIQQEVPITTLDDYCLMNNIERIDLLKIDVEGFEIEVLEGASVLLAKNAIRKLIFEVSLIPLASNNRTPEEVFKVISGYGFSIAQIISTGRLNPVDIETFVVPYFANFLAYKSDSDLLNE